MIGGLRLLLACMVVLNHLWIVTANAIGANAVTGFYIISGFLMTKVIHEVYGLDSAGIARFLVNRALRIFPPYWFYLTATILFLVLFPQSFGQTYSLMQLPEGAFDWFRNISLFYLTWSSTIMIPPAWSLTVECAFYVMMALLLNQSNARWKFS